MVRRTCDPNTKAYFARRRAEGKTDRDIMRCLKRHIAREIYRILTNPPPVPSISDLRARRTAVDITLTHAADQLDISATHLSRLERGLTRNNGIADRYRHWLNQNAA